VVLGAVSLVLAGSGTVAGGSVVAAERPETPFGSVDVSAAAVQALAPATRVNRVTPVTRVARISRAASQRPELRRPAAAQVERQARQRAAALRQLGNAARDRAAELAADQWVLPLRRYTISAGFGAAGSLWSSGSHTGLDFSAPDGTPIVAVTGGVVTTAGYSAKAGWAGNVVVVKLDDGTRVWYAHQSSVAVPVGAVVQPGQVIGYVGSTGNSTGSHLHLEVQVDGEPVDPRRVLSRHGLSP